MSTVLIEVRRARPPTRRRLRRRMTRLGAVPTRASFPGLELDKLISRRGPEWWDSAVRKGSRVAVLAFGDRIAGYANYGRNRARSLYYDGEIYELYLRPEFQGLGFGRRLFTSARRDLGAERLEEHGDVGAVGQRSGDRVLSRARRQRGGAFVGTVWQARPRQGRLRLEWLRHETKRRMTARLFSVAAHRSTSRSSHSLSSHSRSSVRPGECRRRQAGDRTGRAQRIGEQACDRHRADAARHRRDRAGDLGHFGKCHVADDARLAVAPRPG